MSSIPDNWNDLAPLLRAGGWVRCLAWAVGGGDPDGVEIRLVGGRVSYTNAWCVMGPRADRVRLSRLDPGDSGGPHEVIRWLTPDTEVEVRKVP